MLHSSNNLHGIDISASDGLLGTVSDLYFDDRFWHIRYLVADTGSWLPGRQVLLSPAALGRVAQDGTAIEVALTQEQIRNAPGIESNRPVSRQRESELVEHFGWPVYWPPPTLVGAPAATGTLPPEAAATLGRNATEPEGDPSLRSTREVTGYHLTAEDGSIGHVEDFLIDPQTWVIRYLVLDTRNWLPGRKVLTWPQMILGVDWSEGTVRVALTREQIETSPPFDPSQPIERQYEEALYRHYGLDEALDRRKAAEAGRQS